MHTSCASISAFRRSQAKPADRPTTPSVLAMIPYGKTPGLICSAVKASNRISTYRVKYGSTNCREVQGINQRLRFPFLQRSFFCFLDRSYRNAAPILKLLGTFRSQSDGLLRLLSTTPLSSSEINHSLELCHAQPGPTGFFLSI